MQSKDHVLSTKARQIPSRQRVPPPRTRSPSAEALLRKVWIGELREQVLSLQIERLNVQIQQATSPAVGDPSAFGQL